MKLTPDLGSRYTADHYSAREAQRLAQFIAFGPAIFQTARIMLDRGILDMLRDAPDPGLTRKQLCEKTGLSDYAMRCLLEASLSAEIILVDPEAETYRLSKVGWFIVTDRSTRVNFAFNHLVNYRGWFDLEAALAEGRPAGLPTLGDWATVYEGLSQLEPDARKAWLDFDHFYSDGSFPEALKIVFGRKPETLLDVGGNTGRWALKCVDYDPDVKVTILDLPGQIEMMQANIKGRKGADRIDGIAINLLDKNAPMPANRLFDAIWMSQFLDCFSAEQIVDILQRAACLLAPDGRLYIMETLWDRQRFETSTLCLTMTSLYFTAIANGNSKMYESQQMVDLINQAGLEVETMHDNLGLGHTIIVCRHPNSENQ